MNDARPTGRFLRAASSAGLAAYWLTMFTATHIPKVPVELTPRISDKWQHYLAYAILGAFAAWWWSLRRPFGWLAAAGLFALIATYGAFDEATQPLFGRDAELLDWRADIIGAATGLVAFSEVGLFWRRCAGEPKV